MPAVRPAGRAPEPPTGPGAAVPRTVTLVFIVDGVVLYEREQFEAGLSLLRGLVYLARDPSVPATVKVLFTSTSSPHMVMEGFQDEDERMIIDVARLPRMPWPPNDDRVARQLDGAVQAGEGSWY